MKSKKILSFVMAIAVSASLLAGCSSDETKENSGENIKPVLKILMPYQTYDPQTDPSVKRIKEKTGYELEFFLLPNQNADAKLMMEIASGNEYDILRVNGQQFGQLASQGAIRELNDLLDQYGGNIKNSVSGLNWNAASVNGKIYGIPISSGADIADPKGMQMNGLGVRTDILKETGMEIPKNLDEFYAFLKRIKELKGIEPLTGVGLDMWSVASAFGMGAQAWFEVDGKCIPKIKMPQTREYIKFMAKLYKEGLLDKDLPINKTETTIQKFTSGKAAVMQMFFYDIPNVLPALLKSNPNTGIEFITPLNGKDGRPYLSLTKNIDEYEVIPKNSKYAEDAVKYANLRAQPDIYVSTFIGDEGVHYEVKDGQYYPLLPAFDELKNAKGYTGVGTKDAFKMWQARARKTPEMAAAYEKMNADIDPANVHLNPFGLANGLPSIQKYRMTLSKSETDFYIKTVLTQESIDILFDEFIADWEKQGGTEMEKEVNEWYQANKDVIQ